jgi:hypothetical protein
MKGRGYMEIIYGNTEEQYIETILNEISDRTSSKVKNFAIRIFVVLIFGALCLSKYTYDIDIYGYLTESSSLVLLIYIACGILWVILLPIIWWKIKSFLVMKQIEAKKINFSGDIKISLQDDNITVTSEYSKIKSPWINVLNVINRNNFIVLNLKGFESILIPMNAFKEEESATSFTDYINKKIQESSEGNKSEDKEVS